MPAVELHRLNLQIDNLVWQFTRPADFLLRLRDLFELYADRVYRAGQAVPPVAMLPAFHVAPLVLRQVRVGLRPACRQQPAAALAIIDALWAEKMLEYRQLAATLLGYLPVEPSADVVARLKAFARPGEDNLLLETLLTEGGAALRIEQPAAWIELVQRWNEDPSTAVQSIGLKAIQATVGDTQFANLPPLFRIFSDQLQTGTTSLQVELQETLLALLQRSPVETVYLLRQVLPLTSSPATHRLVRLVLPKVPAELQAGLRQALQRLG